MSKIDELIAELCPDGVEYRRVGDIANISRGKVMSKDFLKENAGEYPVYSSQTENEGKLGSITTYMYNGEYLTWTTDGANAGTVFFRSGKFSVTNVCGVIDNTSEDVDIKYLYYVLNREAPSYVNFGMGNPKLMSNVMARISLPVPPLKVQREIVHVLDSFMLLTAELTAELTARKKQYEFYRDELLKPKTDIPMVTLKEIATDIYRGSGIKRDQVTMEGIPCVRYGEIYTTYNTWFDECVSHTQLEYVPSPKYFEHGDILFAITGESVEDIAKSVAYVGHEKCLAGGDIVVLKHKQNPRYLAHVLATQQAREQKSKGKVKSKVVHSNVPSIGQITIPLPPLDVQKRYADVLDNFEKICTDLNIGLPAEIEARQKQYEYYRDLLLTFAEADKMIGGGYSENLIKLIQYVFGYVTLPMGSLFDFRNGLSKGKEFFGRGIPFIRYTDVYNNRFLRGNDITALVECTPAEIEKLRVHRGDVFFTRTSETAEDVGWSSVMLDDMGDCVYNGFTIKATPKTDYLLPEYCVFCFATDDFRQYVTSHCAFTTRASLTGKTIAEYQLAFPSIEKQQEIVEMLSKFHTLCNDLSAGLPAEIEARQKQYEYYRDKLLSFKEIQK